MSLTDWSKIKQIFQASLDKPAAEREAFVRQACGDDAELRQAVLDMVAADAAAGSFLETPDDDFRAVLGGGRHDDDSYLNTQVGAYRLTDVLGEGGMGIVYRGVRDDSEFQREVAVKLIRSGMGSAALLRRFRHERQALAVLDHPNIGRLYDGGTTAEGHPYFIMEYVAGEPITDYCDRHRLSIDDRLKLFAKVCDAVAYAHRNLIVHRDLKPGNIHVTADGEPKLLDFGIATLLDPDRSGASGDPTTAAMRFVTPEYASPEQLRGEPVSTAADVYSLGVLLFELLSGYRPYPVARRSPLAVEKRITTGRMPFPSTIHRQAEAAAPSRHLPEKPTPEAVCRLRGTTPERLQKHLSGDLDAIILKALRPEPGERYPVVEALADDLRRFQIGLPVQARRDTTAYRARKFIRRHHLLLSALGLVFLSLLIGIAGIAWQARIAGKEAAKSRQTLEFVRQMLADANPLESGKELTVEDLLDNAVRRIPQELGQLPEIEGDIRTILGEAYQALGRYDKAHQQVAHNLALLTSHYGPRHPLVANSLRALAVVEQYRGNLKTADSLYRAAVHLYRDIGATESGDYATALNDYGTILLDKSEFDSAAVLFRRSLAINRTVHGPLHYQNGSVLNNLGFALDDLGHYEAADSAYAEALAVFRHNYGEEHPEIANTLNNLAFVKLNVGDTLGSLALHDESLAMWRKLLGDDHPDIGITLHNIAAVNFYRKNYGVAETREREAIAIWESHFAADHPYLGSAYLLLGRILNGQERYPEARDILERSLAIREARLDPDDPQIAAVHVELGVGHFEEKRFAAAERAFLAAHRIFGAAGSDEAEALAATRARLAALYEAMGRDGAAARYRSSTP